MNAPAPKPQLPAENPELATLEAALLRKLVEVLPVGVWLADANGTIVLGNEAGQRVWAGARYVGIEQFGEYKGWWPDGQRIAAEDWALARAITHGETSIGQEIEIECFDGTRKFIRNSAAPVRDEAGALLGAVVVNEDITGLRREIDERADHERALRDSNERFERVARATTDAVWDWDLLTNAVWWNAGFHALFGYPPEHTKPTSESWSDFIHPADRDRVLGEVHAAIEGDADSWSGEYRFRRGDGSYADVLDRGYIQRDGAGRGVRMTGAMMDISARKAAERALAESEARFRSLSTLTSDWIWETDAEHRFLHTPPRLTELVGYRAPHYVGKPRWEVAGLLPVEGDWSAHQRVLARRESFRDFELVQTKDGGSRTFLQVNGEPVYDEAGSFKGYRGTAKDVTPRKRTEEALRESEARFRSLVELSSDWYWEQDEDLRFLPGRQSAQKNRFRAAQYVGRTRWEVVGASLEDPAWAAHKAQLERREPFQDFEYGRLGGDGVYRWVSISGEPVFDAAGRFRGYRGVGRDITARRRAEEQLARFRLAMDASADLIALVDRETMRYVDVNETLCRHLGYTREELLQMHPEQVLPFSRAELEASYDALIAGPDESTSVRSHYVCRDGSRLPFEATRHAIRSGERWIVVGIGRDIRERLAAEEALRRKDAYFRSLVENLSDAIGATDMDWRYLYAGPSVEKILGFKPEELVGRRFGDATAPDKAEALRRDLAERLERTGLPQTARFEAHYKEGKLRVHEVIVSKGTGPEGQPIYVIAGRDVTDRVRAEETLRRFRLALDRSGEMIAIVDLETMRYVDANDSLCAALGYAREELLGMHPDELIPVSREELRATYQRLTRGEDVPAIRSYYRCKDGSRFPYESRRHAVQSADGRWLIVSIARDIRAELAAEEELRKREEEFRAVAENAPDGIMRFDSELRCLYANGALSRTSGRPASWFLERRLDEFDLPPELERSLGAALRRALESGETQTIEFLFPGPRGERHYQARLAPERGADGRPVSVLGISRDITDRKRVERAMAESEARLRSIVHASAEPLLLVDPDGTALFANPAAAALFGRPVAALEGAPLGLPLAAGRPADVDIVLPGGGVRPAEMQVGSSLLEGREVLVVSLHDLSERKQFESHIQHLATHDGLTGLPNRALLGDRIEQAIVHAKRHQGSLALLFVDLDQFKLVNDSFGHGAGDALLVEVAARLKDTVREGDTVARLGGDEFVILLTNLSRPGDSALVARKIADALDRPMAIGSGELRVTASIGISLYPDDGDGLDALLQSADAAMYRAKDRGRNGFHYYSAEMGEQARARVDTEAGLRRALEQGELRLHYQPQVDLSSGEVTALEALLRWEHPQRGMVSPAAFIPVAEESGLIVPIGEWVLREACREAAGWAAAGLDVKVAVNLSARQFWRGSVTEAVRRALAESGLPASRLELEITESVVARDLQQVMLALEQLRRMGVGIAIDDFGTGYSSLAYLRSLPIKTVKIDKSFIHGIPADREATALIAEIVRLAHVLSLGVVAEGVETAEQARMLRDAGCEAMQGFLFARPMPAADAAALLHSGRRFVHGA